MKKLIIVDCENISIKSIKDKLEKESMSTEIVLFLGHNQGISDIPLGRPVEFLRATGVGKDYLDFQLVTEVTIRAIKKKYDNIIVITNDTGFDAAIERLKLHGINAERMAITPSTKQEKKKVKEIIKENKTNTNIIDFANEKTFKQGLQKLYISGARGKQLYTVIVSTYKKGNNKQNKTLELTPKEYSALIKANFPDKKVPVIEKLLKDIEFVKMKNKSKLYLDLSNMLVALEECKKI